MEVVTALTALLLKLNRRGRETDDLIDLIAAHIEDDALDWDSADNVNHLGYQAMDKLQRARNSLIAARDDLRAAAHCLDRMRK